MENFTKKTIPQLSTKDNWVIFYKEITKAILLALDMPICDDIAKALSNPHLMPKVNSPASYSSAWDYYVAKQCITLVSKNEAFTTSAADDAALEAFLSQELFNLTTNQRLKDAYFKHPRWLIEARDFLHDLLTHSPTTFIVGYGTTEFPADNNESYIGRGSTASCRGKKPCLVDKLSYGKHVMTQGVVPYYTQFVSRRSQGKPLEIVKGGRFFTVPKNISASRTCITEPDVNMQMQRWLGLTLRTRFKRILNLDHQHDVHGHLMERFSRCGSHATIDLSNASNSIAYELVKFLLPSVWFDFLNKARSHYIEMPDKTWHKLQMFSSMGNGFTFELESIIFYAILHTLENNTTLRKNGSGDISVFGDDMICRESDVATLYERLEYCGFTVNQDKSFTGNVRFRESCGEDYFNGIRVTPIYFKGSYTENSLVDMYQLANKVYSLSLRLYGLVPWASPLNDVYRRVVNTIPKEWRFYGPCPDLISVWLADEEFDSVHGVSLSHTWLYGTQFEVHYKDGMKTRTVIKPVSDLMKPPKRYTAKVDYITLLHASRGHPIYRATAHTTTAAYYIK